LEEQGTTQNIIRVLFSIYEFDLIADPYLIILSDNNPMISSLKRVNTQHIMCEYTSPIVLSANTLQREVLGRAVLSYFS